jgi:hypothetical protein
MAAGFSFSLEFWANVEDIRRAGLLILSTVLFKELIEGILPRLSLPEILLLGLPAKNGFGSGEFLLGGAISPSTPMGNAVWKGPTGGNCCGGCWPSIAQFKPAYKFCAKMLFLNQDIELSLDLRRQHEYLNTCGYDDPYFNMSNQVVVL